MKYFKLIILGIIAAIALVGCIKDDEDFIPNPNPGSTMYTVDLTGLVINDDGTPITNATIQYRGKEVSTDENGIYRLPDVQANSEHSTLRIVAPGYFDGSRTFRTQRSGTLNHVTKLVPAQFTEVLNGGSGTVSLDNVTITFPNSSIKEESSGAIYTGQVNVAMANIGTDELMMPGDLTAINIDDEFEVLNSFGMVYVELQSPDGKKLNIADGMTATMTYEMPADLVATAPQTIKMWWYDYDLGAWKEGGQASLEGNTYTGEVSHFSCWNYDVNAPSIIVSGRIVNQVEMAGIFSVSFLNSDNQGGRGTTDADGYFSGRVEAGTELTLQVTYYGDFCFTSIYEDVVGPFNEDTDLGDIAVNLSIDYLTITADLLNCNNEPVTDGYIKVGNFAFKYFEDSPLEINIPVCTSGTTSVFIVDSDNLMTNVFTDIAYPGLADLGTVVVCDQVAEHILVNNLIDGFELQVLDSLNLGKNISSLDDRIAELSGQLLDDLLFVEARLSFVYGNGFGPDEFVEGMEYNLSPNRTIFYSATDIQEEKRNYKASEGTLTITTITDLGAFDLLEGTYNAMTKDEFTGEEREISGSFAIYDYN